MKVRATVLAIPATLGLAASLASAATTPVTLSPLGPAHREQIASNGATCALPNTPAKTTSTYFYYPTISRQAGAEGTVLVGIRLLPSGHVEKAWAIESSGNKTLDRAAMETALESTYVAERSECTPVGGDYKVEVDFSLDQ